MEKEIVRLAEELGMDSDAVRLLENTRKPPLRLLRELDKLIACFIN